MKITKTKLDLKKLAEELKTFSEIEIAYIFGSSVNGNVNEASDIDIAVLLNSKDDKLISLKIAAALEEIYFKKIDVVVLNDVNPILQHEIISKGRLLFQNNNHLRIQFETNSFKDYVDYSYFLRRRHAG